MAKKSFGPETMILALQGLLLIALLFGFAKDYSFFLFALAEAVVAAAFFAALFFLHSAQKKDFWEHFLFFAGLLFLVEAFFFLPMLFPEGQKGLVAIVLLFLIPVFFLVFRALFSRDFCFATVVSSDGSECVVKTGFDLLSFTPKKAFVVPCKKRFCKGEKVVLHFKRSFFGPKPEKIA